MVSMFFFFKNIRTLLKTCNSFSERPLSQRKIARDGSRSLRMEGCRWPLRADSTRTALKHTYKPVRSYLQYTFKRNGRIKRVNFLLPSPEKTPPSLKESSRIVAYQQKKTSDTDAYVIRYTVFFSYHLIRVSRIIRRITRVFFAT